MKLLFSGAMGVCRLSSKSKPALALLTLLIALCGVSCSSLSINPLMTFDLHSSFAIPVTTEITLGQDTQWSFAVNYLTQLDTNQSNPSLVYSAKVSRLLLISDSTYSLSHVKSASVYVSSASMKDSLVGTLKTFPASSSMDIVPNLDQIYLAVRDTTLTFTLHLTFTQLPTATDTLHLQSTIAVVANPQ